MRPVILRLLLYILWACSIDEGQATEFPALDHIKPSASAGDQAQAVKDLIGRLLGNQSSHFKVVVDDQIGPRFRDTFNLLSDGETVSISGTSGVAAAMGFYYYLKTYCGCQVTWAGSQLDLPHPLPLLEQPGVTVTTNDRFRYYQNVCTSSYSFAFWDWSRWERHIDWMAINGINLPLAFTGQEAIFQKVYMNMGFTLEDLQEHFGGPAFLAWARMGNMRGWGGPLPQSWIDMQLALQHKILQRMRSLGMIPVLPGFAGHVPAAITRLYPNASVSKLGDWGHFKSQYCCTTLLEFEDPLFQKIGTAFINEMKKEFGVDHVYNADSFNEMTPKSSDPSYLDQAGKAVYKAMKSADKDAIWMMQGWLFQSIFWQPSQTRALLTSVPQGKMIVLDLIAELLPVYQRTESFYGQPFIWCMLHNFGGTMELYGAISAINSGPFTGRKYPNSTMIGTGLAPEGIFQNEAMYEFMNENAYVRAPRNLTTWFADFAKQRYGTVNDDATMAWQLLKGSVFNNTDLLRDHSKGVIPTSQPNTEHLKPDVWYNPQDLYKAWAYMNTASASLAHKKLFRYDLVDVARNSLQDISLLFYTQMVAAYHSHDADMLRTSGKNLLRLLTDLDMLLGSDAHFLLGTWVEDAKACGVSSEDKKLMEYNARNQVTLWGPTGEIKDYGAKQWSGLISRYYLPRWTLFLQDLQVCVEKGTEFNMTAFKEEIFTKVEQPFTFDRTPLPVNPQGDSVEMSKELFKKYQSYMESGFGSHLREWSLLESKLSIKTMLNWVKEEWRGGQKH